ncbi:MULTISPECIES: FAD/NAD(P)-binding oxidoreductase [unclassified Caballeronia]|uniref:FAD/NAD(P)-binding oxidoreductase n=1 Tax=unclassified Caballeronia TaxID=2646786 RepID=UPI00285996FF|nr:MULTISPECIES: FAD/NAD(P)-binding oxidoreductase [unclassified Caballeronia]MDR5739674.1 FAD/NAD(P)-binding oxidoreductase [Caballeronia sp. LZ016]MDR5808140.1 FAD/NAD(P)-binding oxidoreductase [Caballeronia sp. LZ019]
MKAAHFDIAIIGAGPAGLAAARVAAAGAGVRVALIDDNPRPGGQIWRQGPDAAPSPFLRDWLTTTAPRANLEHMGATKVAAAPGDKRLLLERDGAPAVIGYTKLILVTGARERLLPFEGWTLPGVTGAGGLQALVKGGSPVRGERIVVAGSGPLLLAVADTARRHGAEVRAVIEQAPMARVAGFVASLAATPGKLAQAISLGRALGVSRYRAGSVVVKAEGRGRVEAVTIRSRNGEEIVETDRIACGYGLVPNATLALALGCAVDERGAIRIDDNQRTSLADVFAAGECTGIGGMELSRAEGTCAAHAALGVPIDARLARERNRWRAFAARVDRAFSLGADARAMPPADTLICRCEDVRIGDVAAHGNWREAKLQTRCGMGACQGRVCGEAAALYFGWPRAAAREPFTPVRIDTLIAGCEAAPSKEG